jgi:hypothetical protein
MNSCLLQIPLQTAARHLQIVLLFLQGKMIKMHFLSLFDFFGPVMLIKRVR